MNRYRTIFGAPSDGREVLHLETDVGSVNVHQLVDILNEIDSRLCLLESTAVRLMDDVAALKVSNKQ